MQMYFEKKKNIFYSTYKGGQWYNQMYEFAGRLCNYRKKEHTKILVFIVYNLQVMAIL